MPTKAKGKTRSRKPPSARKPKPRIGTCSVCGERWAHPHRAGPIPSTCPTHRPVQNRSRQAKAAAAAGASDVAAQLQGGADRPQPQSVKAALLAAGLHVHADARIAADVMGLDVKAEELEELEQLARRHWPDICQGDATSLNKLLDAQLKSQAILGALDGRSVHPSQRAQAMSRIAQSVEVLHRHGTSTFAGPVKVLLKEKDVA